MASQITYNESKYIFSSTNFWQFYQAVFIHFLRHIQSNISHYKSQTPHSGIYAYKVGK